MARSPSRDLSDWALLMLGAAASATALPEMCGLLVLQGHEGVCLSRPGNVAGKQRHAAQKDRDASKGSEIRPH